MKRKHFVVIGLGQLGFQAALSLKELKHQVTVIDNNESRINEIKDRVDRAVVADASEERALGFIDPKEIPVALVAIGERHKEASIFCVSLLKEMGVKLIYVRASNQLQGKILKKVGADRILYPEAMIGVQVAREMSVEKIFHWVQLKKGVSMAEVLAPSILHNHTILDLNLRSKYGVFIVSIRRGIKVEDENGLHIDEEEVYDFPDPSTRFLPDDVLIVTGKDDELEHFVSLP